MRIIILVVSLLLSACHTIQTPSTTQKKQSVRGQQKSSAIYNRYTIKGHRYTIAQDGAPVKNHAVSFKEPVPAHEPMSRYGNPTEYRVDGRTYEVMKSSTGYKTRGVASWYGMKFHKQRTSSGEPYDMYVMTGAHKTLPLPTYVKVKNLENGRVAVVKINDRGPFHSDRILDLSYAAALKLGVFPKGTAKVEVETLMGPSGDAHYYLQAGAYFAEGPAKKLKDKLIHLTSSPVFVEHYMQHYVVRVGPFAQKYMADNLKIKLSQNGVPGAFSVLI